jgi:protein TonB
MMSRFPMILALAALVAPAVADADASSWQSSVARVIAAHQNYPRSAQLRGDQGTSRLRVALAATGQISQVEVIQSSGSAILDHEAQTMVSSLGRLPAPPSGISSIVVPIVWRLN